MNFLSALRRLREKSAIVRRLHAALREPYYILMMRLYPRGRPFVLPGSLRARLHCRMAGIRPEAYEPEISSLLDRYASKGATVIDVGAHVGLHTLRLAQRVGPCGRVIALEPSPANAGLLREHLSWNRLANVTVVEAIVADRDDEIEFTFRPDSLDTGGFANSIAYDIGGETRRVRMTTIDALCAGIAPDFIKIDVEGAELLALRGARATLERRSPTIVVAIHPDAMGALGHTPEELIEYMKTLGYSGRHIDGAPANDAGFEELVFSKPNSPLPSLVTSIS